MLVTLVIRLMPEGLSDGRFVGQVENVSNGESQLVNDLSELVGFASRAASAHGDRDQLAQPPDIEIGR